MRDIRLHANGHIISIQVDDIAFGMMIGNDAFALVSDLIEGDPNGAGVFSGDIYLTSECKVVDEAEASEPDGVTITLRSGGKTVTVTPEEFVEDWQRQAKIKERDARTERQIALFRAETDLFNAKADGVEDLTALRDAVTVAKAAVRADMLERHGPLGALFPFGQQS